MNKPPAGINERLAKMTFDSIYPHYVNKIEKKGRTKEELNQVIEWLTGYGDADIARLLDSDIGFKTFFDECELNPNVHLIKGVICGYRVEELEESLHKQCRYLDKLVDELARGKKMESILRA
ncbi:MAG: DUF2200 domain-containing protein [Pseudomonadota bacterium]